MNTAEKIAINKFKAMDYCFSTDISYYAKTIMNLYFNGIIKLVDINWGGYYEKSNNNVERLMLEKTWKVTKNCSTLIIYKEENDNMLCCNIIISEPKSEYIERFSADFCNMPFEEIIHFKTAINKEFEKFVERKYEWEEVIKKINRMRQIEDELLEFKYVEPKNIGKITKIID